MLGHNQLYEVKTAIEFQFPQTKTGCCIYIGDIAKKSDKRHISLNSYRKYSHIIQFHS